VRDQGIGPAKSEDLFEHLNYSSQRWEGRVSTLGRSKGILGIKKEVSKIRSDGNVRETLKISLRGQKRLREKGAQ